MNLDGMSWVVLWDRREAERMMGPSEKAELTGLEKSMKLPSDEGQAPVFAASGASEEGSCTGLIQLERGVNMNEVSQSLWRARTGTEMIMEPLEEAV